MPGAIKEPIVEQVLDEWAITPNLSANKVARRFAHKYGRNLVSHRKMVELVAQAKREAPPKPFPTAEWKPWVNDQESPEDTLFLLQLDAIKRAETGTGLQVHEAKWGWRIRPALEGLKPPYSQYKVVTMYGEREVAAYYLKRDINTAALDALITYKPWLPENQQRYEQAIAAGLAPLLFIVSPEELRARYKALEESPLMQYGREDFSKLLDELKPAEPFFLQHLTNNPEASPGWSALILDWLRPPTESLTKALLTLTESDQTKVELRERLVQSWASQPNIGQQPPEESQSSTEAGLS